MRCASGNSVLGMSSAELLAMSEWVQGTLPDIVVHVLREIRERITPLCHCGQDRAVVIPVGEQKRTYRIIGLGRGDVVSIDYDRAGEC